ncbi:MAG: hypothetical protein QM711_07885 [Micropruina sp.]|uniref:hypothetical protein n=1 Tax=Micropruina sp. TaxID=2737536 RepID=UPI0039E58C01
MRGGLVTENGTLTAEEHAGPGPAQPSGTRPAGVHARDERAEDAIGQQPGYHPAVNALADQLTTAQNSSLSPGELAQ